MAAPTNCKNCEFHSVVLDPDPTDWFCDDDVAVLCTKTPNDSMDRAWKSKELFPHKAVTTSCRPYRQRQECERPTWCPLAQPSGGKDGTSQ